jgi:hypothetical protein
MSASVSCDFLQTRRANDVQASWIGRRRTTVASGNSLSTQRHISRNFSSARVGLEAMVSRRRTASVLPSAMRISLRRSDAASSCCCTSAASISFVSLSRFVTDDMNSGSPSR